MNTSSVSVFKNKLNSFLSKKAFLWLYYFVATVQRFWYSRCINILLLLLFIDIPAEKLHSHPSEILASRIFDFWQESWPDSRQDHTEVLATETFASLRENLGKMRSRIPARFWPSGCLFPAKNLDGIHGRIPARFWSLGILLPGKNLARFPSGFSPVIKSWWPKSCQTPAISAGSCQDPSPYFPRVKLG